MILVVDDNQAIRETLRDILDDEGFKVASAANGAEALRLLETTDEVRVVVMDLMMPVMDGWELRRRMAADPRYAGIPVIVLSAVADDEVVPEDFNAVAVLQKPLPIGTLLSLVAGFERPAGPFLASAGGGRPKLSVPMLYGRMNPSVACVASR